MDTINLIRNFYPHESFYRLTSCYCSLSQIPSRCHCQNTHLLHLLMDPINHANKLIFVYGEKILSFNCSQHFKLGFSLKPTIYKSEYLTRTFSPWAFKKLLNNLTGKLGDKRVRLKLNLLHLTT